MKYIRTKDGRILRTPFTKQEYESVFLNTKVSYKQWFELWAKAIESQIIKQADTIEELCDGFVVKIKTGYLIIDYYDKKLLEQDANKNGADVYGAIWTDKGLIYVAKINNKGELELL